MNWSDIIKDCPIEILVAEVKRKIASPLESDDEARQEMERIARSHNVPVGLIKDSDRGTAQVASARDEYCAYCHRRGYTRSQIGSQLGGRDDCTISLAIKRDRQRMEKEGKRK